MSYIVSTTSPTTFHDTKRHRYDVVHRVDDITYDISRHQTTSLRCRTSGRRHRLRHFNTPIRLSRSEHVEDPRKQTKQTNSTSQSLSSLHRIKHRRTHRFALRSHLTEDVHGIRFVRYCTWGGSPKQYQPTEFHVVLFNPPV